MSSLAVTSVQQWQPGKMSSLACPISITQPAIHHGAIENQCNRITVFLERDVMQIDVVIKIFSCMLLGNIHYGKHKLFHFPCFNASSYHHFAECVHLLPGLILGLHPANERWCYFVSLCISIKVHMISMICFEQFCMTKQYKICK